MTDKYGFSRPYASWSEAKKNATGYEAESIFEKVKAAHLKVKNGEVAYTRDTALFDKIEYSWPLLSGLLWVASRSNNRLNLIDFGGALGTSYYQNRSFLSHLDLFKWNIVEQEKFVKCGKDLFEDQHLQFYFNIQDCVKECNPNVILLSGVLQYIEKPYELLQYIFDLQFEYILFDRTAFSASGSECLSVRRIPPEIYDASIIWWFFDENKFMDIVLKKYEMIASFDALDQVDFPSYFKGFIFRRK